MARVKNPTTNLRRYFIVPTIAFSLFVVFVLGIYVFSLRYEKVTEYKRALADISNEYYASEIEFRQIVEEVVTNRNPISNLRISLLVNNYQGMSKKLQTYTYDETVEDNIEKKITELQTIQRINELITKERAIGELLDKYNICKENIIFVERKPGVIGVDMLKCSEFMDEIYKESITLPNHLLSSICEETSYPSYILRQMQIAHNYLTNYYILLSKGRGVEAFDNYNACTELSKEIDKMPKWNSCITNYIEKEATTLIGEEPSN